MQTINKQSRYPNTSKQTAPQNLQQKNTRLPTTVGGGLAKELTLSDEFKNGFPSEGLSVVSNKWWGSNSGDEAEESKQDGAAKADDAAAEMNPEEEKRSNDVDLSGTSLLTAVRRRAATEGQEALKLSVFRAGRVHDVGNKERTLLLGLFNSSLPREWTEC